jgi:hypothetical protein
LANPKGVNQFSSIEGKTIHHVHFRECSVVSFEVVECQEGGDTGQLLRDPLAASGISEIGSTAVGLLGPAKPWRAT